jgi:hypothetical protein
MDLPMGAIAGMEQQLIELGGGVLGRAVGTDVAGLKTVTDGQQIHTRTALWAKPRYAEIQAADAVKTEPSERSRAPEPDISFIFSTDFRPVGRLPIAA